MTLARKLVSFSVAAIAGCTLLASGVNTAHAAIIYDLTSGAIPLSDLVGTGNSLLVGDKLFTNFSYSTTGADMPAASDVNIQGEILGSGSSELWGFNLSGAFQDTNTAGASDALLRYTVTVVNPSAYLISGATMYGDPDVIGTGKVQVTDTWTPDTGNQKLSVYDIEPGSVSQYSDSVVFDTPVASLVVTKDILASIATGVNGNAASLSSIDQLYSQTPGSGSGVPEPASLGLLGLGALGLLARRRR